MKLDFEWLKRENGTSLFEQAALLPILLILIFGAVDINTALQSYSALNEGVKAALRCTYTVDGKCIETSPDERPRLYKVSELIGDTTIFGKEFDYNGDGYWLNLPVYEFTSGNARVLKDINYDVEVFTSNAVKPYFNATGNIDFDMRTATFPFVGGVSALSPSFSFLNNQSENYGDPIIRNISASGSTTSGTRQLIGEVNFRIDSPFQDSHCFISNAQNNGSSSVHTPNYSAECSSNQVGIVFHVTGSPTNTEAGADGSVRMDLVHNGSRTSLGGRAITDPNGNGNFVPRGVHARRFVKDSFWTSYPEFRLYKDINVNYGQNVKLQFYVVSNNGRRVGWSGGRVKVFAAKFQNVSNYGVTCDNALTGTQCDSQSSCSVAALPASLPVQNTTCTGVQYVEPYRYLGCNEDTVQAQGVLSDILVDEFGDDSLLDDYQIEMTTSCGTAHRILGCGPAAGYSENGTQPNYGVPQIPDSNGRIYGSSQAQTICPPSSAVAQNVYWTEHSQTVPNFPRFEWLREVCAETLPAAGDLPSYLANFPKLTLAAGSLISQEALYTNDTDPREMLRTDPRYNCGDIALGHTVFNDHNNDLPSTSLFKGIYAELGCDWIEELNADAVNNGLDSSAYFEAERNYHGETEIGGIPSDQCVTYRLGEGNPDEVIDLGTFEEGSFPAVCESGNCQAEFVGFGPGSEGGTDYNFELAAQHYGFNEIQASYPRAKWNCAGEDCVRLDIQEDNGYLVGTGEVDAPMKLLFNKTVTFSVTERERYEGEFIE